ncbi:MAG TPA: hypothetical protein PKD45_10460 [Flavobacteriales bacterium]|nr:hypothetical protein [Flavobacteriales bacterium]
MAFNASAQYIPPDPFNDNLKASYGIWPNMGQVTDDQGNTVPDVSFYTTGAMPRAFFRKDASFSLVVATRDTVAQVDTLRRLDITCVGPTANAPEPISWMMKDQYAHFYLSGCGPNGAEYVHPYHRVIYPEIYDSIDMHIYSGRLGQKLAFVVNPGGDPKEIALQFEGQDYLDVDLYGNLRLLLADKWVTLPQAMAYQVDANGTILPVNWTATYYANNNIGRAYFDFDAFDHGKPLVFLIGPPALGVAETYDEYGLCWSTYYGGTGFDMPTDIKPDSDGNFYVAGRTESGWMQFPHGQGTNTSVQGASVATLTKFNPSHQLLWTVFHGGTSQSGGTDFASTSVAGVAIKNNPTRIYLAGTTDEAGFHTVALPGAYNMGTNNNNEQKGFVARYNEYGQLQWSTFFGAERVSIQGIDVGRNGAQLVISGTTKGSLPGADPNDYSGNTDAFVTLFNTADNIEWSRFHGGTGTESMAVVRANSTRIVVAGNTASNNIAVLANAPGQSHAEGYHGGWDVFITEFSYAGDIAWATYLGGPDNDFLAPQGMALNKDLYLTGRCGEMDLVAGWGWNDDLTDASGNNGFIARFEDGYNNALWISYLGGGANHSPYCLTVDDLHNLTVAGYTNDALFGPLQWAGHYFQPDYGPDQDDLDQDAFLVRFNPGMERVWATLFGGQAGGLQQPQNIRALTYLGGATYAVGYTSMPENAPGNYFPLDGTEDAGYLFNPHYNYDGSAGGFTDGFITHFCSELTIGITEVPEEGEGLQACWSPDQGLALLGLSDGPHELRVYDAQGRLVLRQQARSMAGHTGTIPFDPPGSALYLAVVDGQQAARFIVNR